MNLPFIEELGQISIKIKPQPNLRRNYPGDSESLKLYFQISNESLHRGIIHAIDGQQHPLLQTHKTEPITANLWVDARVFEQETEEELSSLFGPDLTRIGIESSQRTEAVSRISEEVKGLIRSVNKRRKVMVIDVEIESEVIHRMFESETERAIWESRIQFEIGNCGMVAADLKAAKRLMKSVRIGGEEEEGKRKRRRLIREGEEAQRECRICLEEMKNLGIRLPCQHIFHSNCILKWLQTSHYCPLCRFQMPTRL